MSIKNYFSLMCLLVVQTIRRIQKKLTLTYTHTPKKMCDRFIRESEFSGVGWRVRWAGAESYGCREYMEDAYFVEPNLWQDIHLFGVLDGHGTFFTDEGPSRVASLMCVEIVKTLKEYSISNVDPFIDKGRRKIKKLIEDTDYSFCKESKIRNEEGGSTLTLLFLDTRNVHSFRAIAATVGDSVAFHMRRNSQKHEALVLNITNEHKPSDPKEQRRLTKAKLYSNLLENRVYMDEKEEEGGLNMSRSLGDCIYKNGRVSSSAEGLSATLDWSIPWSVEKRDYLVLATDGLLDQNPHDESALRASFIQKNLLNPLEQRNCLKNPIYAASSLLHYAMFNDNITVLVIQCAPSSSSKSSQSLIQYKWQYISDPTLQISLNKLIKTNTAMNKLPWNQISQKLQWPARIAFQRSIQERYGETISENPKLLAELPDYVQPFAKEVLNTILK